MPARRRATSRRSVDLRPRKRPRQERSRRMNEVILEAAVRVLRRQGATGFTTTRVAEVAGISVGSLYQYYPNKASLLFRVHEQEDERTWGEIEEILEEVETPTRERVVRGHRPLLRDGGGRGRAATGPSGRRRSLPGLARVPGAHVEGGGACEPLPERSVANSSSSEPDPRVCCALRRSGGERHRRRGHEPRRGSRRATQVVSRLQRDALRPLWLVVDRQRNPPASPSTPCEVDGYQSLGEPSTLWWWDRR